MTTPTREEPFEAHIADYLLEHGYVRAERYDTDRALDVGNLVKFLDETQADRLIQLEGLIGPGIEDAVVNRLTHQLKQRGSLDVLRRGWDDRGVHFDLAYFAPASGINPDVERMYRSNRISVMRQVPLGEGQSVDLALSINGVPVITAELKRQTAGQTLTDAIEQYRRRDPDLPLFRVAERAVVHFALDTDAVAMATTIRGHETHFLPFNRGRDGGAGNPDVPGRAKTSYLWEEVWSWDSLLDLMKRFVAIHGAPANNFREGKLIFPRYHQLEVVRKLEAHARSNGSGESYLIQHSAGSGKSNSIAWTAHRLHSLHDPNDERVFHTVVVVTDRRVLDRQIRDTIRGFEHTHGVIEAADRNSQQLADALERNVPIVITTLQKFPFVIDRIGLLPDRRYAVIVDEAHSSQTGDAAREMREALTVGGTRDQEGEIDVDEAIRRTMESAGTHENLSFFAFSATPKQKTLEMFGNRLEDGRHVPFHLYSMRQAIEEGFIMDVLQNYTTYQRYFELTKLVEDDPELTTKEGSRAIARFLELHPTNVAQKAEVMVEHFQHSVRRKINNRAKAMVVTSSRAAAVRYHAAIKKHIADEGYANIGVLVAFSGSIDDGTGVQATEAQLNGFGESELTDQFDKPENRILVVAEKYQTGFDQPLLHTMYVDKKLQGVNAVQTLSRLNRTHPAKSDTFVLDFVNTVDEIREAFQPFYETTELSEATDPNLLYDVRTNLMEFGVIWPDDLDRYAEAFFSDAAIGELESILDGAVSRYHQFAEDEEAQEDFKQLLDRYVRLYSFLTHVISFTDPELEKLYLFARALKPKIADRDGRDLLDLSDDVDLVAFRLEMTSEGDIELEPGTDTPLTPPTGLGPGSYEEFVVRLSELIDSINDRFGTDWDEVDWLVDEQRVRRIVADDAVIEAFRSNNSRDFRRLLADRYLDEVHNTRDRNEKVWLDTISTAGLLEAIIDYRTPEIERRIAGQKTTDELLASDESQHLEFKETFRWGLHQAKAVPGVEDSVIKTVAAFLNSGGGTLIIGVADRGEAVGLDADLNTFSSPDRDSLENWLYQKLETALGFNNSRLATLTFVGVDGVTIARIDVEPAPEEVWAKTSKDPEAFFVRHGNATKQLGGADAVGYIRDQWPSQ
ncbi:MAG: DEAD/DEAH box helicase [Acidimicrobiia bacterium]|nr:DEAD/DEAH box helicase [Acidimicrobiia bacterium]